jgi:ATP-dependent Clp protease adaptor protein ClpS
MEDNKTHSLVLYNDDVHNFQYIMACLVRFCSHTPHQAEQCALIAHNNGKCAVKSGDFTTIFELQQDFTELEVKTEIEIYEGSMH